DPLIRNYELAHDLGFDAVNIVPYENWVAGIVEAVRQDPTLIASCEDAPCQQAAVAEFVRRAFRDVVSSEDVERFVDAFSASRSRLPPEDALADLVALVFSSPRFSFREEVHTDADGNLLPAAALQHLSYTLADSPPSALGFDSSQAEELLS